MTCSEMVSPLKGNPGLTDILSVASRRDQKDSAHNVTVSPQAERQTPFTAGDYDIDVMACDRPGQAGATGPSSSPAPTGVRSATEARLGVVIVTYNSEQVIVELLSTLPAALAETPADVVVVDNGSSDGTVEAVRQVGGCRLVQAENRGYSAGINAGIRVLPDVGAVLILNPDVRLSPGSLPRMLAALDVPGTGLVAPQVRDPAGNLDHSLRRDPSLARALGLTRTGWPIFSEYVLEPEAYRHSHNVDWALGAVLLVSSECMAAVGPWDESFFLYSEETDFCQRARILGFATRYEPSAVAVHVGGASGRNDVTHAMQIINRVRLYRRRHSAPSSWTYYLLTLMSELTWARRGHLQSRHAIRTLLRPSLRPTELNCSDHLIPR
jgi:N-acetylglucosaminyl-diphospho-decaprenol L-rhamnosyltransferase